MEGVKLDDIPIVCEHADVFSDDLPGLPLDRDIEFVIQLQPGITPISQRPYWMPPNELAELKIQLQDCNTRFIKGHKLSNHIRARIKSHVYTIE